MTMNEYKIQNVTRITERLWRYEVIGPGDWFCVCTCAGDKEEIMRKAAKGIQRLNAGIRGRFKPVRNDQIAQYEAAEREHMEKAMATG